MESGIQRVQIPSAIVTLVLGMILVLGGCGLDRASISCPLMPAQMPRSTTNFFRFCSRLEPSCSSGLSDFFFSLMRFSRRPGQLGDGIAMEGNLPLEVFWTAVPAVVVLFVGLYSYDIYDRMGGMVPLPTPMAASMVPHRLRSASGEASAPQDPSTARRRQIAAALPDRRDCDAIRLPVPLPRGRHHLRRTARTG